MAPAVKHNPFKGYVKPKIEKNWPNIYFEVIMYCKTKWHMAQKHTKNLQRICASPTAFFKVYRELQRLCA